MICDFKRSPCCCPEWIQRFRVGVARLVIKQEMGRLGKVVGDTAGER